MDLQQVGSRGVVVDRRRQEDNIKMDLQQVGSRGDVVQDSYWWRAFMNAVLNLWVL